MQLKQFKICMVFLLLTSCALKSPTKQLVIQTKQEISTLEKQVKNSSCKNDEKEILYNGLTKMKNNINLINQSCEMEKSLLKEKITKLKLLMMFILCVLLIIKGVNYVRINQKI